MGKETAKDISRRFAQKHPIVANIIIIALVGIIGLYAVYFALAIFTKHGCSNELPSVEGRSYTEAIRLLDDHGFKVDIRDSVYREDVRPGFVVEQFPKGGSIVKPGRKIFLYINAVHPKEVVVDDNGMAGEYALKGESYRSAISRLEELGFKNIRIVRVLGTTDRVVKVLANGRPVRKRQKVAVNASIVVEVSDGRLKALKDSLQDAELMRIYRENAANFEEPAVEESAAEEPTAEEEPLNEGNNQYLN